MPLIHVYYSTGALSLPARDALADELTNVALDCEKLPTSPFVKSTTWIYFHELPSEHVYHGGIPGGTKIISLEVNAFEGGLDGAAKKTLFEHFTRVICKHAGIPFTATAPIYIIVRDVAPTNWGVFGTTVTLDELRNAHPLTEPI